MVLYVEGGEQPLAVEGGNVEYEENGDVSDVDEEVNVGGEGDEVIETEQNDNVDFDWLEEGLERPDFNDDVFGAFTQTEGNGVGETAAPQRSNVATIEAPQSSNAAGNNSPQMDNAWEIDSVDENDWLEPPVEDDMESLVGSNDDEPATNSIEKVFNVQTGMNKPKLCKGMKFPNAKVFREALREYAIQKLVDIWFKLNEKEKISVYCKNKCGWRCYASKVSGELTFQIKTWIPECTCPRSLQNSQNQCFMFWLGDVFVCLLSNNVFTFDCNPVI